MDEVPPLLRWRDRAGGWAKIDVRAMNVRERAQFKAELIALLPPEEGGDVLQPSKRSARPITVAGDEVRHAAALLLNEIISYDDELAAREDGPELIFHLEAVQRAKEALGKVMSYQGLDDTFFYRISTDARAPAGRRRKPPKRGRGNAAQEDFGTRWKQLRSDWARALIMRRIMLPIDARSAWMGRYPWRSCASVRTIYESEEEEFAPSTELWHALVVLVHAEQIDERFDFPTAHARNGMLLAYWLGRSEVALEHKAFIRAVEAGKGSLEGAAEGGKRRSAEKALAHAAVNREMSRIDPDGNNPTDAGRIAFEGTGRRPGVGVSADNNRKIYAKFLKSKKSGRSGHLPEPKS